MNLIKRYQADTKHTKKREARKLRCAELSHESSSFDSVPFVHLLPRYYVVSDCRGRYELNARHYAFILYLMPILIGAFWLSLNFRKKWGHWSATNTDKTRTRGREEEKIE